MLPKLGSISGVIMMCRDVASRFVVTPLKMSLPRARIELVRYGAWSAGTTDPPAHHRRAVASRRHAQRIEDIFSWGVIAARASLVYRDYHEMRTGAGE